MSELWRIRCLDAAFATLLAAGTAIVSLSDVPTALLRIVAEAQASVEKRSANNEHGFADLPVIETAAQLDRVLSSEHVAVYVDVDWSVHAKMGLQLIERAVRLERQQFGRPRLTHGLFSVDGTRVYDAPLYTALVLHGMDQYCFTSGAGALLFFHRGELSEVIDCVGCLTVEQLLERCRRAFER